MTRTPRVAPFSSSISSQMSLSHPQNEGMAFFCQRLGAGRAYGRSALGRRFEGSEGRGQHAFGVVRPLVQLRLGLAPPPWRELFHIPNFCHPRAAPAGLQAVGPAHVGTVVGVRHELKAPAALGYGDHHRHRPCALTGPIVTEEAIADLATATALPFTADVLRAPLPHTREIGDEVVDGFRGGSDFDTGFTMHVVYGHKRAPH